MIEEKLISKIFSSPFHSRCHQEKFCIWYITLIPLCIEAREYLGKSTPCQITISREVWENLKYVLGILAWSILGSMLHKFP